MLDNLTTTPSAWHAPLAERYRMGPLLGSGSAAEVHRAEDSRLRRPVAIKLFRPDPDPVAQRRFGAEVQVLAQLAHPGLVSIYDAGIDGVRPFLVMQLIEGRCLRARLADGPLTPDEVVRLGVSLTAAIAHMHRRGVVHRDVKPSNILLDGDEEPYLADFGIAQLAGEERLTGTDELVGTACYLAPEQLRDNGITPTIDVYALGLVLLECLTGELVYPGDNQLESALSRLHHKPRVPAHLPPRLATLLTAMTSTDPLRRPTAQQCADTLRACERTTSATRPIELLSTPEPPPLPEPADRADLVAVLTEVAGAAAEPAIAAVAAGSAPAASAAEPAAALLAAPAAEGTEAGGLDDTATMGLAADPLANACRTAGRRTRRALRHLGRAPVRPRSGRPYLVGAGVAAAAAVGVVFLIGARGEVPGQNVSHPLAPAPAATAALGGGDTNARAALPRADAAPGRATGATAVVAVRPLADDPAHFRP